jgi:superfamily I DNA and/or RNA helicase
VVLIGDHHQLPPVVKNMAFQKYRCGGNEDGKMNVD